MQKYGYFLYMTSPSCIKLMHEKICNNFDERRFSYRNQQEFKLFRQNLTEI